MVRIALDAMGGDLAPQAPIEGALRAARKWRYEIQLVGRESVIREVLRRQRDLSDVDSLIQIVNAPEVIEMGEHPASAVRSKRHSSMAVGIDLVKKGASDGFVSAGNTGGVLATALLALRRIEGITSERPALVALIPTIHGSCVVLDVGANVDVKPEWLAQFALMGSLYAEIVLDRASPSVATLC
jgi:glycerol-3-phosphate acyltransferase PlsX